MNEFREEWWLMYTSFPDLNWARLRVYGSGKSEVFDMDGRTHIFKNEKEATYWLFEDEFTPFNRLDKDDENEYGIDLSTIKPPRAADDLELKSLMYVKS